ncbi:DUF4214 domain-containing protein [Ramlibacter sp. WS9]|uniref:DUF4214 domain-containing protein n=1 Tax=Ramlibacter sp. WS9 TaxID=1882741 RepID=UPI00130516BD|nr:DUF4214 domain-containing protein [Ramlibacter sp. WS9]
MSATIQMHTEVSQLYVALFGRAPEAEGLDFWADQRADGQSMAQIADQMFNTSPARAYFPVFLTNQEIISSFYFNVLGRQADAEGLAFWTAKLDAADATPGSVIAEMIGVIASYGGTDTAGLASAALYNNRSAAAQFYGEHDGSLSHATSVLTDVTADAATITAARTLKIASGASGTIDAGGFAQVSMGALSGDLTISHVVAGTGLTVTASTSELVLLPTYDVGLTHLVTWQLADATGASDSLAITLESAGTVWLGKLALAGIEDLTVTSIDTNALAHYNALFLENESLRSIVATGNVLTSFSGETHVEHFDATGLSSGSYIAGQAPHGTGTLLGGPGDDSLSSFFSGYTILAGAGDDGMVVGAGTVTGGAGADVFQLVEGNNRNQYATITDFNRSAGDTINVGWATSHTPTWNSTKLALAAGATFDKYLDAAAAGTSEIASALRWFQYGGNTYLVGDNSTASTFSDGVDLLVKFVGTVDLSSLTLSSVTLG